MLGVGIKLADRVDFEKPLLTYITDHFTPDEVKQVSGACRLVHDKRNKMLDLMNTKAPWDQLKPCMLEYLVQLEQLAQRFPFGEDTRSVFQRTSKAVAVPFTYHDSMINTQKATSHLIAFEQMSVLFNYGARLSREAVERKPVANTGLKEACQLFKEAAGLFHYLSANEALRGAIGIQGDLTPPVFTFLSKLMIAQAQACFFEMAAATQASPEVVAKLAAGCASLFASACGTISALPALKAYFKQTPFAWEAHVEFQRVCFLAAANYWWAKTLAAKFDYGTEIAYLQAALKWGESASQYETPLKSTNASLIANKDKLNEALRLRLRDTTKDNETIYFKLVPSTVDPVEEKVMVKPTDFFIVGPDGQLNGGCGKAPADEFKCLVPSTFRQAANEAVTRILSSVQTTASEAEALTNTLRVQLNSAGLPAAIDALDASPTLPDSLWAQIESFQKQGGKDALALAHKLVLQAGNDARERLKQVDATLASEETADSEMKEQFGDRWPTTAISGPGVTLRNRIHTVQGLLQQASNSDKAVQQDLERSDFTLLTSSRADIESKMPRGEEYSNHPSVGRLKAVLGKLSKLVDDRCLLLTKLKKTADTVTSSLASKLAAEARGKGVEQVITASEEPLTQIKNELKALSDEQDKLMVEVIDANEAFIARNGNKSPGESSGPSKKEKFLQDLNASAAVAQKLMRNFAEGQAFYTDLVQGTIEPLKKDVSEFAFHRTQKRTALIDELQQAFAAFSLATPGSALGNRSQNNQSQNYPPQGNASPHPSSSSSPSNNNNNNNAYGGYTYSSLPTFGSSGAPPVPNRQNSGNHGGSTPNYGGGYNSPYGGAYAGLRDAANNNNNNNNNPPAYR